MARCQVSVLVSAESDKKFDEISTKRRVFAAQVQNFYPSARLFVAWCRPKKSFKQLN